MSGLGGLGGVADDRYRNFILPEFPPELVTVKFILGRPPTPTKGGSWKDLLNFNFEVEQAQYGDMVMLDVSFSTLTLTSRSRTISTMAKLTHISSGWQIGTRGTHQ